MEQVSAHNYTLLANSEDVYSDKTALGDEQFALLTEIQTYYEMTVSFIGFKNSLCRSLVFRCNLAPQFKKMKFVAEIDVMPLKAFLDPQGRAVTSVLKNMGMPEFENVRIGKHVTLEVERRHRRKC